MKLNLTNIDRILTNHEFLLLGIGASLVAIHLAITSRIESSQIFGTSLVFVAGVSSLIWDKRRNFNLESGIFASSLGLLLIGFTFVLGLFSINSTILWWSSPFISAFGLALLASGFKGLKQYTGELFALFCLAASMVLPRFIFDISPLTAKFSAIILWYTGFNFVFSGQTIYTPTGGIEIASGCSGIELIIQMLGLAILFILMFPLNLRQKITALIVAPVLGFIVNGLRVSLLGIMVIKGNRKAFEYWHDSDGSLIFSVIAVLLFGLFCWFLLRINQRQNMDINR